MSGAGSVSVTFASTSFDMRPLARQFAAERPGWRIHVWPEPGHEDAEVLIGWNTPAGLYAGMPRLRLVHGIAAGVDNILKGQTFEGGLPVCRVVDDAQASGMSEYVLWSVLHFHRGFDLAFAQQSQAVWKRPVLRMAADFRVGVMGLGAMGETVATFLAVHGYKVSGWSRSARQLDKVETFSGPAALPQFLSRLDALVCLLPLTEETRGILCTGTFNQLPRGAALIHAGRGEHLVPANLRDALASGQLRGAIVDVFAREPLPADDPLWATPGLVVTPHMATMASAGTISQQIIDNIERLWRGEPLLRTVDTATGY